MTRREFIAGAAATGAVAKTWGTDMRSVARGAIGLMPVKALWGDEGMDVDGVGLPDWAVAEIRDGLVRYRAWKGTDSTVAFPLLTDIHSHIPGTAVFSPAKSMMIDLVAVKPEKRIVHVFRIGLGGPESELEYTY